MASRRPDSVWLLAFALALIFLYLRFFLFPATPFFANSDQNLFLLRALRILHGQVLYRDFFELVTPGTDLLYAALFRIFGVHAWVIAAWSVAVGLALCCVITRIASRILRGALILLPALLFLVFDFDNAADLTHHWYSALVVMAAVSILMDGTSILRISAAGALCGVATLFTQTEGAIAFVALAVYLLWLKKFAPRESGIVAQLAALMVPFALIVSCALGYFAYKAGARTLYFDLVVFPVKYLSSGDVNTPRTYLRQLPPVHALGDLIRLLRFLVVYALVPYIYFFGMYRLWRTRKTMRPELQQQLVLLHLAGLALFLAVASGPRYFRLCTVAPPAFVVCVWLISHEGRVHKLTRACLWCASAAFALLPLYRQVQWHATLHLPIGKVAFSDPPIFQEYKWLVQRTCPSELIFNHPGVAYYLSLDSPASIDFVASDEYSQPKEIAAVVQSLQRRPPHFIAMFPESTGRYAILDHTLPFRQYVHSNYRLAQTFYLDRSRYEEIWELDPKSGK